MSAKHTPGPWFANQVPTSAGSAYSIAAAGVLKGCAWIYADGIRKGIDDEIPRAVELAANARLMAAAPDLLAALRNYAEEVQPWTDSERKAIAVAAINKATGA